MQEMVRNLTIEYLMDTSAGENLRMVMDHYAEVRDKLYTMAVSPDSVPLAKMKAGTILTLAFLKKMSEGKRPKTMTKQDWEDIARTVAEYSNNVTGEDYSLFVFDRYADYIYWSAQILKPKVSEERVAAIEALAEELRTKAGLLRQGVISETAYIEDCLWISLEAIIKLLASSVQIKELPEASDLVYAMSMYAFEYGRFRLYDRERALVAAYLENQKRLDDKLEARFSAFQAELEEDSRRFNELISNAFDPGFRDKLKNSVELARAAGVREEEILDTVQKVDSFFLD